MGNITIAAKNALDGFVTWTGNADAGFPLTNLDNKAFAKVWRYSPPNNLSYLPVGNFARIHGRLSKAIRSGIILLPRHNLGPSAQVRVRGGLARLDLDYTQGMLYDANITHGGGANGTVFSEAGYIIASSGGRLDFDPTKPLNAFLQSENLLSMWAASSRNRLIDAQTLVIVNGSGYAQQGCGQTYAGETYTMTVEARVLDGSATIRGGIWDGSVWTYGTAAQTLTDKWKKFTFETLPGAGSLSATAGFYFVGNSTVQLRKMQMQHGSLSNGTATAMYRKTTTNRAYKCRGLLIEEARTNHFVRSNEFDNASWAKFNITPLANNALGVDGLTSAELVGPNVDGLTTTRYLMQTASTTTNGWWTVSWYVRRGTGGDPATYPLVGIQLVGSTAGNIASCNYNMTTGVASAPALSGGVWTEAIARCESVGNLGYYRVSLSVNITEAITSVRGAFFLGGYQNVPDFVPPYYVSCAQLEPGKFPTSYIPTTTAAVTRTADTASSTGSQFTAWFQNGSGTFFFEGAPLYQQGTSINARMYNVSDGTANNIIEGFFNDALDTLYSNVTTGGVAQALATASPIPYYNGRFAAAHLNNDVQASTSGSASAIDTVATLPGTLNRLDLGSHAGGAIRHLNGHIRRFAYFPFRLLQTELNLLTAGDAGNRIYGGIAATGHQYDGDWSDALKMKFDGDVPTLWGRDYDVPCQLPWNSMTGFHIELFDPDKTGTSTPFELGRVFMGRHIMQSSINASYGMTDAWLDRNETLEAHDGRLFFNERPKGREVNFNLDWLTEAEGASLYEMMGTGGTSEEVGYYPDPDNLEACQRHGFVAHMSKLNPLAAPLYQTKRGALVFRKKL